MTKKALLTYCIAHSFVAMFMLLGIFSFFDAKIEIIFKHLKEKRIKLIFFFVLVSKLL